MNNRKQTQLNVQMYCVCELLLAGLCYKMNDIMHCLLPFLSPGPVQWSHNEQHM